MKIDDETLSAFLDSELPVEEMEAVREAISGDESLSDRLAELAAVDATLASHYSAIDQRPLPKAVMRVLENDTVDATRNFGSGRVLQFPRARLRRWLQQPTSIAAAIALALGVGATQWWPSADSEQWRMVAQSLETVPAGETRLLDGGEQITPRLTFMSQSGQYCRQFQRQQGAGSSENIACRTTAADWELIASVESEAVADPGQYQPASGGSVLDSTIDAMISGDVLDSKEVDALIAKGWE